MRKHDDRPDGLYQSYIPRTHTKIIQPKKPVVNTIPALLHKDQMKHGNTLREKLLIML